MREMYFNHRDVIQEAARLSRETELTTEGITLSVPDKLREGIRHEAFYCRAPEDDMPSRIVLHGASILSLLSKGALVDFEYDLVTSGLSVPGRLAATANVRRLSWAFPGLEESEKITSVADAIKESSENEVEVSLNPLSAALLETQGTKNELSNEVNFIALASLVNYVGSSEREGLCLSIETERT